MIRVPENNPGTDFLEFTRLDGLDGSLCAHRHEYRGGNSAVVGDDGSCPCFTVRMLQNEFQSTKL